MLGVTRVLVRLAATLVLSTWCVAPAASAAPASERSLGLSAFVDEVLENSPQLEAQTLRTRAARLRVDPAGALPDPFVAVGIDELALGRRDEADGSSGWPLPVLRYQVNQTFPLPPERRALRKAAASVASVSDSDVRVTRRSLRVAAVQLFLQARYVQAAQETNAALIEALDDAIASARARYVAGGAAHHDVLLAAAERAILERDGLVLKRELDVLAAEMNELRGLPADTEVPRLVDDDLAPSHRPLSLGAALAEQPELREADARVRAADARVRVTETAGHPDLSVQLMAMQSLTPSMPSGVGAMVGITVPIFWRSKQAPRIDAAKLERRASGKEREALRRRLEAEWVSAERAYDTSVDTVRLYKDEVLPATRAAVDSAKHAYVAGDVQLPELISVVRASLAVELEYVASQIDVRLARLRMDELLAMPVVVRVAPRGPTLFGRGMGAGMGAGMREDAMPPARPIGIGSGMRPPDTLDVGAGDGADEGMGGMR